MALGRQRAATSDEDKGRWEIAVLVDAGSLGLRIYFGRAVHFGIAWVYSIRRCFKKQGHMSPWQTTQCERR